MSRHLPSTSSQYNHNGLVDTSLSDTLYQQGMSLRCNGDYENSFKCLYRAAELGHIRAIFAVGWAYYQGLGVVMDIEKAMGHFQQAAQHGDNDAAYYLAQCCEQRDKELSSLSLSPTSFVSLLPSPPSSLPSSPLIRSRSNSCSSSSSSGVILLLSSPVSTPTPPSSSSAPPSALLTTVGGEEGVTATETRPGTDETPIHRAYNYALEAVTWYMVAAQRGHALSQYRVGMSYMDGYGVDQPNPAIALRFLLQAAEQHYPEAEYRVGQCYEHGIGTEIDLSLAFQWYMKAAIHHHNPLAQYHLGQWYLEGTGVPKQPIQAFQLYILSAKQGYLPAQLQVGKCYRDGIGVERCMEQAVYWYNQAAEQGSPTAQNQLALCLLHGNGVECNPQQAVEIYIKAANQGYIESQFSLACCYRDGIGTLQDPVLAAFWFQQAANIGGDHQAMNNLGWCYRFGFGVEQNDQKAFECYMNAAKEGDAVASANVAYYYRHGIGVDVSLEKAVDWYRVAAEANDSVAQYELGCLLYYGLDGGGTGVGVVVGVESSSGRSGGAESDHSSASGIGSGGDPTGSNTPSSGNDNIGESAIDERRQTQIQEGIEWLGRSAGQGYVKAVEKLQELLQDSERQLREQGLLVAEQGITPEDALAVDDLWTSQSISQVVEEMVEASLNSIETPSSSDSDSCNTEKARAGNRAGYFKNGKSRKGKYKKRRESKRKENKSRVPSRISLLMR